MRNKQWDSNRGALSCITSRIRFIASTIVHSFATFADTAISLVATVTVIPLICLRFGPAIELINSLALFILSLVAIVIAIPAALGGCNLNYLSNRLFPQINQNRPFLRLAAPACHLPNPNIGNTEIAEEHRTEALQQEIPKETLKGVDRENHSPVNQTESLRLAAPSCHLPSPNIVNRDLVEERKTEVPQQDIPKVIDLKNHSQAIVKVDNPRLALAEVREARRLFIADKRSKAIVKYTLKNLNDPAMIAFFINDGANPFAFEGIESEKITAFRIAVNRVSQNRSKFLPIAKFLAAFEEVIPDTIAGQGVSPKKIREAAIELAIQQNYSSTLELLLELPVSFLQTQEEDFTWFKGLLESLKKPIKFRPVIEILLNFGKRTYGNEKMHEIQQGYRNIDKR